MTSHFFNMLMCYEKNLTLNLIAFFNKLLYKHYNLHLWHIDVETQRKNNEVFLSISVSGTICFHFQSYDEISLFSQIFHYAKKNLKEIIIQIKRL